MVDKKCVSIKMNKFVNKFLLAGDKFMPHFIYLKQRKNWKVYADWKLQIELYINEFDKACFQHNMAYGKSKDLTKRTQSEKALKDKAFKTATIKNMMAIKED